MEQFQRYANHCLALPTLSEHRAYATPECLLIHLTAEEYP